MSDHVRENSARGDVTRPAASDSGSGPTPGRQVIAVVLAAGESTRMSSDLVKVLHPVCGRPMVEWVIDACREAGCSRSILIVGHQSQTVREAFADRDDVDFVEQNERLGTGHAVQQAEPMLSAFEGDVVVLAGDGPLIKAATLRSLIRLHQRSGAVATMATAILDDPTGYGRIVRNGDRRFLAIIEERDATSEQRLIREVNPSYYCFRSGDLFQALGRVDNRNRSGEFYLTDTLGLLRAEGGRVELLPEVAPEEARSINTPRQLREVESLLARRLEQEAPQ